MYRISLILILAALAGTALPGAEALSRNASVSYRLALGVVSNAATECDRDGLVFNGACFQLYPNEKWIALTIEDDTRRSISVEYHFMGRGVSLDSGYFCDSSSKLKVPHGADQLVLVLGESGKFDSDPVPGCHLQRGTSGVIHAFFH